MVLDKLLLRRAGLPESISFQELSKLLIDMMSQSLGTSMEEVEVEVLGTDETLVPSLRVSIKEVKEIV